jgi:NADH-quinone oxidoreductase subunit H
VIIYLLAIPSLAIILAGFASANPLSSLGASREVKLLLSYEFPFLLAILVPILKAGSIRISDILNDRLENGAILFSFSGVLSFIVVLLCMQAKMGLVPFDIAEAETEIIAGPLTEYSGSLLAIFKLNKMLMLVVMPLFILTCFWKGFGSSNFLLDTLKLLFIVVIFTLIRNTNPRVRIDQAMRFFWFGLSFVALIALVLAMGGM